MLLIVLKKKCFNFFFLMKRKIQQLPYKLCALFLDVFSNFEQITNIAKKISYFMPTACIILGKSKCVSIKILLY